MNGIPQLKLKQNLMLLGESSIALTTKQHQINLLAGSCTHDSSLSGGGVYWIPGRQQLLASMPIPPNGTTTAKCDADLMWLAGYGAQSHNVYFSTNKTAISTADPTSPMLICELKTPANVVTVPEQLKPGVTYYWRVDSKNGAENVGQMWQFQCKK